LVVKWRCGVKQWFSSKLSVLLKSKNLLDFCCVIAAADCLTSEAAVILKLVGLAHKTAEELATYFGF